MILRVVLIDDELPSLAYIRAICEQIPTIQVLKAFNDVDAFIAVKDHLDYDFCISDIVMPSYSGIQLAQIISKPMIFISAHSEFAAEAYDIEIIDYLRKPIQRERLERAVEKVKRLIESRLKENFWTINTSKGKITLNTSDIVSFSTDAFDRRDKLVRTKDGSTWIVKNKSFDQLIKELSIIPFLRVSKSDIVNRHFINGYNGNILLLKNVILDREVFISETYKKEVITTLKGQ